MKSRASFAAGWKLTCLAVLLAVVLSARGAWAGERVLVPQDMPLPLYSMGLGHTNLTDGWAVAAFYYPVDTIPSNYNLWSQPVYDYPVGYVTPYVEGALIFGEDPLVPEVVELHNAPQARVPMWFTPVAKWTGYTIKDMRKAGALVGWADFYYSVAQNGYASGAKGPWHHQEVAFGYLEDGRPFKVWSSHTDSLYMTRVEFGQ